MSTLSDFNTPVDRHKLWFQYVTTPTADTPGTTILLHFDTKRYLFGRIAEGTQRACIERGFGFKKARSLFLTGETNHQSNSGLLGMILTMADVISETSEEDRTALGTIRIHGGPKIWHTIACARRFIFRTGMPLSVFEASPDDWKLSQQPDFFDENILLWALPLTRTPTTTNSPLETGRDNTVLEKVKQDQNLRKQTVHDMFDSDWKKDSLYESKFNEVNLPAVVWVRDAVTKELSSTFCHHMSDAPHIAPDQTVFVRLPWPAARVADLPPTTDLPSSVSMCYIVKGRHQRGRFVAEKAKAAGVSPGPAFGKLAAGESVTTNDGRTVTPQEVMEPVLPGPCMAILDVPDVQYLPDLLQKLISMRDANILTNVHAFLWTLSSGVLASQSFLDFKAHFPDVKHVVSSPECNANHIAMDSSAASATRLNRIRPHTFPVPLHVNSPESSVPNTGNSLLAQRGLILQAAPTFECSTAEIPPTFNGQDALASMSSVADLFNPNLPDPTATSQEKYKDITIATLGTGSAAPSKYRNVSGNLLHIPSLGYFIFDAGEGTLGQLKRLYSSDELQDVLCNLHMIWISHLHADHHLGTVSLLAAHKKAVEARAAAGRPVEHHLYLLSERNMPDYIEDYRSIEDNLAVMLRCVNSEIFDTNGQKVRLHHTTLPITRLDTTLVSHCHGAQAIAVTFSNGFKISYSGDCRPSATFARIGRDSDVLIHEATFDDGMEGDAAAKRHCTIGEALGVAWAMKAKNVILTHFSQRYQKLPTLADVKTEGQLKFEEADNTTDQAGAFEEMSSSNVNGFSAAATSSAQVLNHEPSSSTSAPINAMHNQVALQKTAAEMSICIAFDLMRVNIPQIKDMWKYYPAIEAMFNHEESKSADKKKANREANEAINKVRRDKIEANRKAGEQPKKEKSNKKHKREQILAQIAQLQNPPKTSNTEPQSSPTGKRHHRPASQSPPPTLQKMKKQKTAAEIIREVTKKYPVQ